jgi:hypothetical protein
MVCELATPLARNLLWIAVDADEDETEVEVDLEETQTQSRVLLQPSEVSVK